MKLESLKKDKFEAFKENEILNKVSIVGGLLQPVATCMNGQDDCMDRATSDGTHTDGGGNGIDFSMGGC